MLFLRFYFYFFCFLSFIVFHSIIIFVVDSPIRSHEIFPIINMSPCSYIFRSWHLPYIVCFICFFSFSSHSLALALLSSHSRTTWITLARRVFFFSLLFNELMSIHHYLKMSFQMNRNNTQPMLTHIYLVNAYRLRYTVQTTLFFSLCLYFFFN